MVSYLKAGVLGGIILFIWGFLSWTVFPWQMKTLHGFKDEKAIAQVIQANAPVSGIYFMPLLDKANKEKAQTQSGPMVFASVQLTGVSYSMTLPMLIDLITLVITASLVAWMLSKTTGLSYLGRVGFVMLFALAAAAVTDVPYWNWLHFDSQYILICIANLLIGWFFAGLVLAKLYKE